MEKEELKILPYIATSLSVIGRFIFMYLIYKYKSDYLNDNKFFQEKFYSFFY
jgi:hypothetical protein